ncbi:zinc metalloprotease [Saccharomonospora iraqiensis]|uniref:hypothetical protein n=1 Tax=Saccharomonospora iraqiensis TaxID=52698 RepID=UPI0012FADD89|nr:hypothetical protein [Saccharomonospora iraqiensis]
MRTWNQSPGIDLFWTQSSCPRHCVPVHSGNYGDTGWASLTSYDYWPETNEFDDGTMTVQLNDYYQPWRRNLACHELGHAIGLGHNTSRSSCLWSVNIERRTPHSDDFAALRYDIYP